MRRDLRQTALGLACVGLLLAAAPAFAQNASSFGSSGGFGSTSIGGGASFGSGSGSGSGSAFGGSSSFGGSMSGNSAFGGTSGGNSAFGGTSGTNTGRGGTTQVGSTSFLGPSYANPLAMGLSGSSGTTTTNTAFGNALYNLTTNRNATATVSTSSSNQQNSQYGAGYNIRRLPAYATTLKIKDLPPPPTGAQVRTDLQTMIAQSPDLDPRDSIRIVIDGQTVVLQGRVPDDDERRLVQNMVLLTPHVYQVRNELTTK